MFSARRIPLLLALAACAREAPPPRQGQAPGGAPPVAASVPAIPLTGPLADLAAWRDSQVVLFRADSGSVRADSLFVRVDQELRLRVTTASTALYEDTAFQRAALDSAGSDSLRRALAPAGVDLVVSEGTGYLELNLDSVATRLQRFLTAPMREYLRLRAEDQRQGFSEDAGLTITWDQLAERVAKWDRFAAAYPRLATEEPAYWYGTYLRVYLTGMDNSRIFTFEGDSLEPEVRRSYERFARTHPDTRAGTLVSGHLAALAKDGWRDGPARAAFLERADVATMLGVQPPVR